MKKLLQQYSKWLVPILLVIAGFLFRGSNATSFLGLISWCLGALVSCYYLLAILKKSRPKAAKVLKTILTTALIMGILVVSVTGLIVTRAISGDTDTRCDYIVVLGAKVNGTSPSRTLRERIDAAADYLKANPETIAVVSGGQGPDEGISEALCMFNGLVDRGIQPERIWMEGQATSTWENLHLSLDLIEEKTGHRPEQIGVVSSEFHLFRASLFADECGVEAVGIPGKTGDFIHFLNYYLREIAGVWHYIILGGQYT